MSYILEALKKAQSERQLGTAPSIHTMPIPTASSERAGRDRLLLMIAAGGVLLALAAGALWLRQAPPPQVQAAPAVLDVTAPPAPPVIVVPSAPTPPPPVAAVIPVPVRVPAPAPVQAAAPAPAKPVAKPAPVPQPAAPVQEVAPDENVPFMTQLPEQVQRDLPRLTFGGYMYSKNPADRLLLIDNVLRHEGQEVAPGLILEQLQPRAAVLNYRGTRYRVAY